MTAPDMSAAVEAGARTICMVPEPWPCPSATVHRAQALKALTAALPHILEPLAAECDAWADLNEALGGDRAMGSRDAHRSIAKKLREGLT